MNTYCMTKRDAMDSLSSELFRSRFEGQPGIQIAKKPETAHSRRTMLNSIIRVATGLDEISTV